MRKYQKGNGGVGILGLLGVIFIVLKLCGVMPVAEWSWWWVTAPLWGGFVAVFIVIFFIRLFRNAGDE